MRKENRQDWRLSGGFYYRLNENGEAIICGAEDWPEILVIPEIIDGHTVVEIGDGAFSSDVKAQSLSFTDGPVSEEQLTAKSMDIMIEDMVCKRLKKVTLPETIRRIGCCAFYQNNEISEVNIPRSVEEIDSCAFSNVWGVTRFEIPATTKVYKDYPEDDLCEEQAAFEGCVNAEFVFI